MTKTVKFVGGPNHGQYYQLPEGIMSWRVAQASLPTRFTARPPTEEGLLRPISASYVDYYEVAAVGFPGVDGLIHIFVASNSPAVALTDLSREKASGIVSQLLDAFRQR